MKRIYLLILAGFIIVTAFGCGTVKGFGDDISTVGHWFTRAADRATR